MRKLLTIFFGLAIGCQASSVFSVTFTPATLSGLPGDVLSFSGTLTNNDLVNTQFINSDSFALAGFTVDTTPFLIFAPISLGPGATTALFQFLTVTIPNNQTPGTYTGTFTAIGGLDGGLGTAQDSLGTGSFTVDVSSAPEPSTLALLLGGAVLIAGKRRRTGLPACSFFLTPQDDREPSRK
jgi:hypothetical protein